VCDAWSLACYLLLVTGAMHSWFSFYENTSISIFIYLIIKKQNFRLFFHPSIFFVRLPLTTEQCDSKKKLPNNGEFLLSRLIYIELLLIRIRVAHV
jgi:hypothetical protein